MLTRHSHLLKEWILLNLSEFILLQDHEVILIFLNLQNILFLHLSQLITIEQTRPLHDPLRILGKTNNR